MTANQDPIDAPEIRASDREREQTTALLKQACVEGRLTLDEFGQRVQQVLAARTRGALQEIVRDLPVVAPVRAGTAASTAPEISRTSVVISGVAGFSRALALQRDVQQVAGGTEAKVTDYSRGVLGLDVQHEAAVDLAACFASLPGIRLHLVESAPGQLQLSVEA